MYRLSDVSLSFGSLKVLENFSAEFGCNQFTCLFGPSGIGKSTILNLLSGLIKPDSGEVSVTNAPSDMFFRIPVFCPGVPLGKTWKLDYMQQMFRKSDGIIS